jgi:hypothetical protein
MEEHPLSLNSRLVDGAAADLALQSERLKMEVDKFLGSLRVA